ncbi:hypothetical protein WDW37_19815 [Bdellovibrionota bacterium FG-1]
MELDTRSKVVFQTLFMLLTLLNLRHAMAGNSTDRGGGDGVVFDDQVVLADPYMRRSADEEGLSGCPAGTEGKLHPQLQNELKRIGRILSTYGAKDNIFWPALENAMYRQRPKREFESIFVRDSVLNNAVCGIKSPHLEQRPL